MQHRDGSLGGFTKRYGVKRLVYFEVAETMDVAIAREKQLKRHRREWKRNFDRVGELCVDRPRGGVRAGDGGGRRGGPGTGPG
jgi:putative endonuclease